MGFFSCGMDTTWIRSSEKNDFELDEETDVSWKFRLRQKPTDVNVDEFQVNASIRLGFDDTGEVSRHFILCNYECIKTT